jgi:hypothetical protein
MSRSIVRGERGQALPALALIAAGLVAFTVFVVVPLGSADDRKAEVRTGADAAALAAVESAADDLRGIGTILPPGLGGLPGNGDIILGILDGLQGNAETAAADYAARNDSDLIDFRMTVSLAGPRPIIEAYAKTRSRDAIEDTTQYARAEATARLDVLGGFCGVGGVWGLELDDGTCRSVLDLLEPPEPPEPSPTPTPTPTGTETPSPSPTPTPTPEPLPHRRPLHLADPYLIQ